MTALAFTGSQWSIGDILIPLRRRMDGHGIRIPQHSWSGRVRCAGDTPTMLVFFGLTLVHAAENPIRLFSWNVGGRVIELFQFTTGIWLMHCAYSMTVDLALGAKAWI